MITSSAPDRFEAGVSEVLRAAARHAPAPPDLGARLLARLDSSLEEPEVRAPGRRWLPPLLAAAVVALLAIAVTLVVTRSHRQSPASSTSLPSTRHVTPSPSATSEVRTGIRIGPWNASTVGGPAGRAAPVANDDHSLFAADGGGTLFRLDATTGDVLASHAYPSLRYAPAFVVGTVLWTTPEVTADGIVTLRGVDTTTLAPAATVTLHVSKDVSRGDDAEFAADPAARRLYVGAGERVLVIDAQTRRVVSSFAGVSAPATITGLALAPDGGSLYVTGPSHHHSGASSFAVFDPRTGHTIRQTVDVGGDVGAGGGLTASAGGIWVRTGAGMTDQLDFRPSSDPMRSRGAQIYGGGGLPVSATVMSRVVWLGGTGGVVCADPDTGAVRARASVATRHGVAANIAYLTEAAGHLYAYYQSGSGPSPYLLRLSPPTACDG